MTPYNNLLVVQHNDPFAEESVSIARLFLNVVCKFDRERFKLVSLYPLIIVLCSINLLLIHCLILEKLVLTLYTGIFIKELSTVVLVQKQNFSFSYGFNREIALNFSFSYGLIVR